MKELMPIKQKFLNRWRSSINRYLKQDNSYSKSKDTKVKFKVQPPPEPETFNDILGQYTPLLHVVQRTDKEYIKNNEIELLLFKLGIKEEKEKIRIKLEEERKKEQEAEERRKRKEELTKKEEKEEAEKSEKRRKTRPSPEELEQQRIELEQQEIESENWQIEIKRREIKFLKSELKLRWQGIHETLSNLQGKNLFNVILNNKHARTKETIDKIRIATGHLNELLKERKKRKTQ